MDIVKNFIGESITIPGRCTTAGTARNSLNEMGLLQQYQNTTAAYFPLAAAKVEVSCVNAADVAAGTGAQKILIIGLDANYDIQYEEIATGATTNLITKTTKTFTRVFAAEVTVVGSSGVNVGDIWLTVDGLGGTYTTGVPGTKTSCWLKVAAGFGIATSGIFTVPRGRKVRLESLMIGARTQPSEFFLFSNRISYPTDNSLHLELFHEIGNVSAAPLTFPRDTCLMWTEKTDIFMQCLSTTAAGVVSATMNLRWVNS